MEKTVFIPVSCMYILREVYNKRVEVKLHMTHYNTLTKRD
jgi:hypothetical protein